MTIWICSLAAAPELAQKLKPSRVVSLLSPYDAFPEFTGLGKDLHLHVAIHDITQDIGDWQAPASSPARTGTAGPLQVWPWPNHCSRSSAHRGLCSWSMRAARPLCLRPTATTLC